MIREKLQVLLGLSKQLTESIYTTPECAELFCEDCAYNAICGTAKLTLDLIEYQIYKYDAKGEFKDDNN